MPRNISGTYTLAPGNPVVTGTIIEAAWANPTLSDIANALTDSLSRTGQGGMLVPFRNADGTIGTPGMSWVNEPSSGWYRAGLNDFWYSVGNENIFRITKNGIELAPGKVSTNIITPNRVQDPDPAPIPNGTGWFESDTGNFYMRYLNPDATFTYVQLNSGVQGIPQLEKGAANGVASLDGSGQVPASQLGNAVLQSEKGVPLGVATLDATGKVPVSQIPSSGGIGNFTDLTVTNSTILGDFVTDSLTINAGDTLGSNIVATRAVGTAFGGFTIPIETQTTFTSDPGGSTVLIGAGYRTIHSGANPLNSGRAARMMIDHGGTALAAELVGVDGLVRVTNTGNVTFAKVYGALFTLNNAGSLGTGTLYNASGPSIAAAGTIGTLVGYQAQQMGNAAVNTVLCFAAVDQVGSVIAHGLHLSLSSGANKHNLYIDGTALNYLQGDLLLGSPTAVAGAGGLFTKVQQHGIDGATSLNSIFRWDAGASSAAFVGLKSRGVTVGSNVIVQDGDLVARLIGYGANGTGFTNVGQIGIAVDGVPGPVNDMPGRIMFSTTPDASGVLIEAMRIDSAQTVITKAGTVGSAPLRIPHGTAPTTPVNGDLWTTVSSVFARVNGATIDLGAGGGGAGTITIGTTGIIGGTIGRVLFEAAGNVVSQDAGLFYNPTTDALQLAAGTAAAPTLAISTANMGMFSPGANVLGFSTQGAENFRVSGVPLAVNFFNAVGQAAGSGPLLYPEGADVNQPINISAKGNSSLNFYSHTFGATQFSIEPVAGAVNRFAVLGNTAGNPVLMTAIGASTDIQLSFTSKGAGGIGFSTNGLGAPALQFYISHIAGAVNFMNVLGGATGNGCSLVSQGSDANIRMIYAAKGAEGHLFQSHGGAGNHLYIPGGSVAINYWRLQGSSAGLPVFLGAEGSDANIPLHLSAKGISGISLLGNTGGATMFQARLRTLADVNYASVLAGPAGSAPIIEALGPAANIGMDLVTHGNAGMLFQSGGGVALRPMLQLSDVAASTNYVIISNSAGGNPSITTNAGELALTSAGAVLLVTAGVERFRAAAGGQITVAGASITTGFGNVGDMNFAVTNAIKSRSTFSAWVRHNAAGTITRSLNVASVTKNSTGNYTANITAGVMADGSYGFAGMVCSGAGPVVAAMMQDGGTAPTATTFRYAVFNPTSSAAVDPQADVFVGFLP